MAIVLGLLLIVFGTALLWSVWQAHQGFWQTPRSQDDHQDHRRREKE